MLQQLLHLHIRCNSSPIDLLEEMACNVLPQVSGARTKHFATIITRIYVICFKLSDSSS